MKIKYTEEVSHEIHLDDDQMDQVTIETLRERFDIPTAAFIKGNKLWHNVEYQTSHSWDRDEEYRAANEMDKHVLAIIEILQKQKQERQRDEYDKYYR